MKKIKAKSLINKSDKFVLLKNVGSLKSGEIFDSYEGSVSGVDIIIDGKETEIKFYDKNYFKLYNKKLHN